MRCCGCCRKFRIGDLYIEDTASNFIGSAGSLAVDVDAVVANVFGGHNGKVVFCESCTDPGGYYAFETFDGDENDA